MDVAVQVEDIQHLLIVAELVGRIERQHAIARHANSGRPIIAEVREDTVAHSAIGFYPGIGEADRQVVGQR